MSTTSSLLSYTIETDSYNPIYINQIPTTTTNNLTPCLNTETNLVGSFVGYPYLSNSTYPGTNNLAYGYYFPTGTPNCPYTSIHVLTITSINDFPIYMFISTTGGRGGGTVNASSNMQGIIPPCSGGGGCPGYLAKISIKAGDCCQPTQIEPYIFSILTTIYFEPLNSSISIYNGNIYNTTNYQDSSSLQEICPTIYIPLQSGTSFDTLNGGQGTLNDFGTGGSQIIPIENISYDYPEYTINVKNLVTDSYGGYGSLSPASLGSSGILISGTCIDDIYVCGGGCAGQYNTTLPDSGSGFSYGEIYTTPSINGGGAGSGYFGQSYNDTGCGGNAYGYGSAGGGGASSTSTSYQVPESLGQVGFFLISTNIPST